MISILAAISIRRELAGSSRKRQIMRNAAKQLQQELSARIDELTQADLAKVGTIQLNATFFPIVTDESTDNTPF